MATVYKIELVSHWVNYHPKDIEKIIKEALKQKGNEIEVKAQEVKKEIIKNEH